MKLRRGASALSIERRFQARANWPNALAYVKLSVRTFFGWLVGCCGVCSEALDDARYEMVAGIRA